MAFPESGAVKVCGITRRDDAMAALEAGADFVGLVFSKSPRRAEPAAVGTWLGDVRKVFPDSMWVGVFLPEDVAEIGRIVTDLGLDVVQFHGTPVPDHVYDLEKPVWAGLRLRGPDEASPEAEPRARALLVDTFDPRREGGTGKTFPWEWVAGWSRRRRLILSGGLDSQNVAGAIAAVRPYGVDASSGLEESPGRKSHERVRAYVESAREAFRKVGD